ncbi:MAG: glycoside hydrolase family 30 beta sandwich domain-containing protein [Saprospiraceae bacterium]|nr:hypothetical protein [Saprospiraceae bacterium]
MYKCIRFIILLWCTIGMMSSCDQKKLLQVQAFETSSSGKNLQEVALNKDGSTVVILFNPGSKATGITLNYRGNAISTNLKDNAIQTILIH